MNILQKNSKSLKLLVSKKYKFTCNLNYNFQKISNFYKNNTIKQFSTDDKGNRYTYDYESPEDQNVYIRSLANKFLKFGFITLALSTIIYRFFLKKFNPISKEYNLYLVNEKFELIFANRVSKYMQELFKHEIYSRDTSEVDIVFKIYKNLLDKNKVIFSKELTKENIFIVDSPLIAAFMLKNGDLYISSRIVELSSENEDEIGMLIAAELSHVLMGKSTNRIINYYIYDRTSQFFERHKSNYIERNTIQQLKLSEIHKLARGIYFYPDSKVSSLYEEIEILNYSLKLLHNANFDLERSILFMKKFDEKLKSYPANYNEINLLNTKSRYYDVLSEAIKIYLLK